MILTTCICGADLNAEESRIHQPQKCARCGRGFLALSAEPLEAGAGGGDFDAALLVLSGPYRRDELILLGGVTDIEIGKLPERHLALPGIRVSRTHARLERIDFGPSRWRIVDCRSTNGLFVNGRRTGEQELRDGDMLRIGEYELQYRLLGPQATESAGVAVTSTASRPAAMAVGYASGSGAMAAQAMAAGGAACPSCDQRLSANAQICIDCGIDIRSGRPILTAKGVDEDALHIRAENILTFLSWPVPTGFYPVASEAFGVHKPIATWVICGLTIFCSLLFLGAGCGTSWNELQPGAHFMLWPLESGAPADANGFAADDGAWSGRELALEELLRVLAGSRPTVEFRWYQLFTHALLHADLFHLAGNMLFLLVFGTRVNALIGNAATAVLYPLLAVAGAVGEMWLGMAGPIPIPMLGASGAVMGMAGAYLILFPLHRVFMALWVRWFLLFIPLVFWAGFHLSWTVFAIRGFWVVLFYIAFDVLYGALRLPTGVAHFAHLGGFSVGAVAALALLIFRVIHARGGDILSVTLGRHAWPLIGKPSRRKDEVPASVLAEKAVRLN